jgi:hypothetical protein
VYHLHCIRPKLKTVPKGDWHCQDCVQRIRMNAQYGAPSLSHTPLATNPPFSNTGYVQQIRLTHSTVPPCPGTTLSL